MNIWKDFKRVPLPNLLSFIVDNRGKTVPTDPNGTHKLIATNCIDNEDLYPKYEKIRYLNDRTFNTWFRAHPKAGDIIFVCKGTPGKVCLVPDPVDFSIAQDMLALRVNSKLIYNKYLLAVLRSWKIQKQIEMTSIGDVIPHFKKSFLCQLEIPLPDMRLQKKIGDSYYKISRLEIVNKQINDNLLSIMKAYFDHFESEYEVKLSEIADISSSKRVFAKDYQNTGIPFYRGKEISKLSAGEQIKPELFISEQKFKALKDSAPLENQILITAVGTVGNIYKVENNVLPFYFKDGNIIRVNLKNKNLTNYIYLWLISQQGQEKINASLIGSTQKALTIKSVKKLSLSLPTDASLQEFNKKTSILFQEISNNKAANKILDSLKKKLLQRYF